MVRIKAIYSGAKRCRAQHEPSGTFLETDAPKDNEGLGESFSPTDLLATALGTCILTTIAIVAERDGVSVVNATMSVEKVMSAAPRKVESLKTIIELPKNTPLEYRSKIEITGNNCPVRLSLHPDVRIPIEYRYTI